MKKSPHSSLQNQIRFTAVMVKKWGLSQSSCTSYRKLVGHQSSSGQVPHCMGTGDRGQGTPSAARPDTRWHRATQSSTARAKGKRAEESCKEKLQLLLPMAAVQQAGRLGRGDEQPVRFPFGCQCWGCPEGEGQRCPTRRRQDWQRMAMVWESLCALHQPDLV